MTKQEVLDSIEKFRSSIKTISDSIDKLEEDFKKNEEVMNGKWKPEDDDVVFVLWAGGNIEELRYNQITNPKGCYCQGNVFRTRAEAEAVRDLRDDMQRYDVKVGDEIKYVIGRNLEVINAEGYSILGLTKIHEVIYQITFKTKEDAQRRADILNRLAKAKGLI